MEQESKVVQLKDCVLVDLLDEETIDIAGHVLTVREMTVEQCETALELETGEQIRSIAAITVYLPGGELIGDNIKKIGFKAFQKISEIIFRINGIDAPNEKAQD